MTMQRVDELGSVTYTHRYVSMKRLTWMTMAITSLMGLLYFVVGFPPAFDTFSEKMYFHAIGIGLAALAAYLIIGTFELERFEPPLDLPISYRAFGAVISAALGGLVFLFPSVSRALPHVGMLLFICAFLLILDVGGALLIELLVLPRKLAGAYRSESHNPVQYLARLLPLSKADLHAYRGGSLGYWLTLSAVASFFIAEIIGFVNLWVRELGPSIFGRYMSWLGLGRKGFLDATLDPHSHMIALALMAGIVGVASVRFRLLDEGSSVRRWLAKIGLGIAIVGVIGTTVVLAAVAFLNYEPPTLFAGGPDAVNGMAGDDVVMTVILLGALVVSLALVWERAARRDAVTVLFAVTWLAILLVNAVAGFYIELHENVFQGSGAAKDASFAAAHPITGIFLLPAIAIGLLLVSYYRIDGRARRVAAWAFGTGLVAAVGGTTLWTFADPSKEGAAFWIYIAGLVVSYLAVVFAALAIRAAAVHRYERSVPPSTVPLITRTAPIVVPRRQVARHPVSVGNGRSRA
jgi:hypothetical protein